MINGILNHVYEFFNNWLFGNGPIEQLMTYENAITTLVSLFLVGFVVFSVISLVFGLVKYVFNMWRGY